MEARAQPQRPLRLQGYIFFGAGFKLYRNIKARITQAEPGQISYILLDFHMTQRVDLSSAMDLLKPEQLSEEHGIHIACTSASSLIRYVLTRTYHSVQRDLDPNFLPDLDYALEWCEDSILAETHLANMPQVPIERQIDSHVLLNNFIACVLSERLSSTNHIVEELME